MDAGERCLPGPRGAPCGARGALGALSGGGIIGIRLPPSTLAFGKGLDVGRQDLKSLHRRGLGRVKYLEDPCKIALGATTRPFRRESWGWGGPRPLDRVPSGGERGLSARPLASHGWRHSPNRRRSAGLFAHCPQRAFASSFEPGSPGLGPGLPRRRPGIGRSGPGRLPLHVGRLWDARRRSGCRPMAPFPE